MNVINDSILAQGEAWKAQIASRQITAVTVEPEIEIPQPSTNGEFPSPVEGALWMAVVHHKRQTPLKGKAAFMPEWDKNASTDPAQIRAWAAQYPGCNFGSVADDGPIFETDSPEVRKRFSGQFSNTLTIQSSELKGHRYYLPADVEHIAQNATAHGDFSLRKHNAYCVSPGSVHPQTGKQYRVVINVPMAAPTADEVAFWNSERAEKQKPELTQQAQIPSGQRNSALASIAGKLLDAGLSPEKVKQEIIEINEQRCSPALSRQELEQTIFKSIDNKWSKTPDSITRQVQTSPVVLGGKPVGQTVVAPTLEIPKIETPSYPKFPAWLLKDCHVYDNYIKEVCEKNCRYAEMMFVPALAIVLNYVGTKCRISFKGNINGSMVNIIGRKGRVIKSTSVQDMFDYYEHVGVFNHYGTGTRNAEGKSLCWTAGSTEGVGVSASRVRCQNILLYFDELKTLADKAGIEGSSMGGHLLSMLQSGKFANETKSVKGNFQFEPGTYTASVITCCTDRMFVRYWSKLIAFSDGLEDRATLILQPDQLKDVTPRAYVPPSPEAITQEKRLIGKAVAQQTYELVDDFGALEEFAKKYGNRSEIRAEEWALAFAIQMGKDRIDSDCIEKGIALEAYNIEVKKYLNVREAETREATIQNHIIQILMQNGGSIPMRELNKRMRPDRYGTALWYNCYSGLVKNGWTAEIGTGVPGDPKRLVLLRVPENEDD